MDIKKATEKSLVKKAQEGDLESFEELMHRHKDYIFAWIQKKTQNQLQTEELLQITFIKCWKNIKKFKGNSGFKTWACSISRNLFIDEYRKKMKNRELSLEECPDAYGYQRVEFDEGYKKTKNEDLRIVLNKILDKLSEKHREVLYSSAVEELSYKEISIKYNVSIGTVMSRLYYAKKKAHKLMRAEKDYV